MSRSHSTRSKILTIQINDVEVEIANLDSFLKEKFIEMISDLNPYTRPPIIFKSK